MFTFMVSSLNYALRCSVVSVPGLIWMFEKRSEGWKKRSQTGNSLLLMSSQKRLLFFFAQNSSQGIMHDKWFGMRWMRTEERHFWSISEAVARKAQAFVTGQMSSQSRDVCVCLHCQGLHSVFSNTQERVKRINEESSQWKDPSQNMEARSGGVKWHIYQNTDINQNHI